MQKKDLEIGEWYYVEYLAKSTKSKRRFVGPAKFMECNEKYEEYFFYSPLNNYEAGSKRMCFRLRDVKRSCNPLPNYLELYSKAYGVICNSMDDVCEHQKSLV